MSGLLERFRSQDRAALARLLSHVENQSELGREALAALGSSGLRNTHIIGITGPPGAGKSTLVSRMLSEYRRRGITVAVLAIDPSSPMSGGATLGDRIRMLEHGHDDGVFVRSMASRGQLGGIALTTFDATQLLASFGFDLILIETVGTGQDEVDIAVLADTVLLVQVPGLGDGVQTVKAGVLEIADVIAVNKADLTGARALARDLRQVARHGRTEGWPTPVALVSATEGEGVEDLCDLIESHRQHRIQVGGVQERALARLRFHARLIALNRLDGWITGRWAESADSAQIVDIDAAALATALLSEFASSRQSGDSRTT